MSSGHYCDDCHKAYYNCSCPMDMRGSGALATACNNILAFTREEVSALSPMRVKVWKNKGDGEFKLVQDSEATE